MSQQQVSWLNCTASCLTPEPVAECALVQKKTLEGPLLETPQVAQQQREKYNILGFSLAQKYANIVY